MISNISCFKFQVHSGDTFASTHPRLLRALPCSNMSLAYRTLSLARNQRRLPNIHPNAAKLHRFFNRSRHTCVDCARHLFHWSLSPLHMCSFFIPPPSFGTVEAGIYRCLLPTPLSQVYLLSEICCASSDLSVSLSSPICFRRELRVPAPGQFCTFQRTHLPISC